MNNIAGHKAGPAKNQRIQILRGIAILAVVIIHSSIPLTVQLVVRPFLNFAVALFIFLSGYLTKMEITNVKTFAGKRIIKVLVPYVVWTLIYSIPYGAGGFLKNLLTARSCAAYYYIFVYIQLVLLTPLICRLLKSKYSWIGWTITPVAIVLFRYVCNLLGIAVLSNNCKYLFATWFVFYYLGLAMGNGMLKIRKPTQTICIAYGAAVALSMLEGVLWYLQGNSDMATTQLRITSIVASTVFCVLCGRFIRGKAPVRSTVSKALIKVGDYSFGIYLSHILVRQVLGKLIGGYMFAPIDTLLMLGICIICIAVGKKLLGEFGWILGL